MRPQRWPSKPRKLLHHLRSRVVRRPDRRRSLVVAWCRSRADRQTSAQAKLREYFHNQPSRSPGRGTPRSVSFSGRAHAMQPAPVDQQPTVLTASLELHAVFVRSRACASICKRMVHRACVALMFLVGYRRNVMLKKAVGLIVASGMACGAANSALADFPCEPPPDWVVPSLIAVGCYTVASVQLTHEWTTSPATVDNQCEMTSCPYSSVASAMVLYGNNGCPNISYPCNGVVSVSDSESKDVAMDGLSVAAIAKTSSARANWGCGAGSHFVSTLNQLSDSDLLTTLGPCRTVRFILGGLLNNHDGVRLDSA